MPDAAPEEPDATDGPEAVPVVDPAEAVDLLFENDGSRSDETAKASGAEGGGGADALGATPCGRARPAPVVNLKHGPDYADVRPDVAVVHRVTDESIGIIAAGRSDRRLLSLTRKTGPRHAQPQRAFDAERGLITVRHGRRG